MSRFRQQDNLLGQANSFLETLELQTGPSFTGGAQAQGMAQPAREPCSLECLL